ncbi:hypothetical protein GF327_04425 [Candidatus Woesearchaeota archaeon]|nr:hypothetical protein [Candidatus Woesearchaeota archaeon]
MARKKPRPVTMVKHLALMICIAGVIIGMIGLALNFLSNQSLHIGWLGVIGICFVVGLAVKVIF